MEIESLDENAAWHKVFTSGSEELKSKLKKVHAKNPKFQDFLKSIGHEGEQKSAAQAKKDVAVINKTKAKAAEPKPADRIELIRQAAEKRKRRIQMSKHRASWGGEVPGARYDDPITSARAGIPIRGYRLGEAHAPLLPKQEKVRKYLIAKEIAAKQEKRQAGTSYGKYLAAAKKNKLEGKVAPVASPKNVSESKPASKNIARSALKNLLAQRKGK